MRIDQGYDFRAPRRPPTGLQARVARWLVSFIADAVGTAYQAHCLEEQFPGQGFAAAEDYWFEIFRRRQKLWLPVARFLHNEAALDQLAAEAWWE